MFSCVVDNYFCRMILLLPHNTLMTRRKVRAWRSRAQTGWERSKRLTKISSCPTSVRHSLVKQATTLTQSLQRKRRQESDPHGGVMNSCCKPYAINVLKSLPQYQRTFELLLYILKTLHQLKQDSNQQGKLLLHQR